MQGSRLEHNSRSKIKYSAVHFSAVYSDAVLCCAVQCMHQYGVVVHLSGVEVECSVGNPLPRKNQTRILEDKQS